MEMMIKDKDEKTEENPALALLQKLRKLPIPFIAALAGGFAPNTERFSEGTNLTEWETVTGVGVADLRKQRLFGLAHLGSNGTSLPGSIRSYLYQKTPELRLRSRHVLIIGFLLTGNLLQQVR